MERGESLIPCDWRVYDQPHDGITKNEHFAAMLLTAEQRAFVPECVLFDGWYASLDNLKLVRRCGWRWLTRRKANRRVSIDYAPKRALERWSIAATGTVVHLEGYGLIRVFRVVAMDGDTEYWATSDLAMGEMTWMKYAAFAWGIEVYHRARKQECHVERAHVRAARAQRNHIGMAIRAGSPLGRMRLEWQRLRTGISWAAARAAIVRDAVRTYLAHPCYLLPPTA